MDEGTRPTTESPAHSHIIKRPRLTKRLDDSRARIILLVAPAGYGKTTLARQWLAQYQRPLAWYRATRASADVVALATGLAVEIDTALADGDGTTTVRMRTLAAVQQRPDVLARALRKSRESWPKQLVIAIDDYHQIDDADAEAFVGELVTLLPATFLLTTRSRPSWFTPRLSVYDEVVEVVTAELEMTPPEAVQVFEASSRQPPAPATLELARGWPAVIGLAARMGRTEFPAETLPHSLYEFLAADLLQTTTPETQRALTVLALAGTSERALARELVGGDADLALDEAEKRGLLTFEGPVRIVLHPLLGEFLIERLRENGDQAISELVDPLVEALKSRSRWDECLSVAEALPETSAFAPEIIELSLQELLRTGRVATVRRWIDVTRRMESVDPIVELAEAEVAFRAGEWTRSQVLGAFAAKRLASQDLRSRAELVAGRAAHLSDDRTAAMTWFKTAEASAVSPEVRAIAVWGQFLEENERESDEMDSALERLADASDGTAAHELRLVLGRLSVNHTVEELDLAGVYKSLALIPLSADPLLRLSALNKCAWTIAHAARYQEAIDVADRLLAEAESSGIDFAASHGLSAKARALVGLRQFAASQRVCGLLIARLRREHDHLNATNLAVQQARLQISLGDLERAADHLFLDPDPAVQGTHRAEHEAYRGLVDAASGRHRDAAKWIGASFQRSRNIEARAVARIAAAVQAVTSGPVKIDEVLKSFELVMRSGHLDAIVMGYRAQPELIKVVCSREEYIEPITALLIASNDDPLARMAGLRLPRASRNASALSPRETEVYELMIQGRTNREIAKRLFITESTTKVHVRHILEKLGVRSRVEAVRAWRPENESGFDDSG